MKKLLISIALLTSTLFSYHTFAERAGFNSNAAVTSGSDYSNASPSKEFLDDAVSNNLKEVNGIFCFLSELRTEEFVGRNYRATIDSKECFPKDVRSVYDVTVNTERTDANSPQETDALVKTASKNNISVHLSVTTPPNKTDLPYGDLQVDYQSSGLKSVTGTIKADASGLQVKTNKLTLKGDFSNNTGYFIEHDGSGVTTTFFAFDATYLITVSNGATKCFDRNQEVIKSAKYKLYTYPAGTLVTIDAGFPFSYSNGNKFGWMYSDGVWTEDDDLSSSPKTYHHPKSIVDLNDNVIYTVTYVAIDNASVSIITESATPTAGRYDALTANGVSRTLEKALNLTLDNLLDSDFNTNSATETIYQSSFVAGNLGTPEDVSLKDGVILTDDNSKKYVVKAYEKIIKFKEASALSACSALTVPKTTPALTVTPNSINPPTASNEKPEVINGVKQ